MQLLEGPEGVVETLFDTIKQDPRHNKVYGLVRGDISERTFPDWQMGFIVPKISQIRQIEGFSDFLESSWRLSELSQRPTLSHRMLLSFRDQKIREP